MPQSTLENNSSTAKFNKKWMSLANNLLKLNKENLRLKVQLTKPEEKLIKPNLASVLWLQNWVLSR